MIGLTYVAEMTGQLAYVATIPQLWSVPFLLWLRFTDTTQVSKWLVWFVMTLFLGSPYGKPTLASLGWRLRKRDLFEAN